MSYKMGQFTQIWAMGSIYLVGCDDIRFWRVIGVVHLFSVLMKKFLRNITIFIAVLLLLALVTDYAISNGLKRTERGHFYTMNALMRQKMDADMVILGNSRAAGSYNPALLDSILATDSRNLGVSGQPFGVSYLRWQLYKRNNVKPKLLIINIDYAELNIVTNGFEKEQYYPYMRDTLIKPYLDLYGFTRLEKYVPMYRYRGDYKLMGIGLMELFHLHHDTKGNHIKGYSNADLKWNGEKLEGVIRNGKVKCQCNQQAVELLNEVVEGAINDGIFVVFVYAPVYKVLKDNLDEIESMEIYNSLSLQYGVPILDFSEMEFCSDSSYFIDANHVNSKGATQFSLELAHKIDSLGLLKISK